MWPKSGNYYNKPADAELNRLLSKQDEQYMEILKNANDELERDLSDISAVCLLVSNNRMSAEAAMTIIQNIVG
jgi:hypothetical protein